MVPWTKKYRPVHIKDVYGQEQAVRKLTAFIDTFKSSKKKALLLYGPSGCGKTCLVHAAAADNDLELLEVNASDFRNAEQIDAIVGEGSKQLSLFMKKKLILVDEADGLSGTKDRGGLQELVKLIATSSWPIVVTANDVFDSKFSGLRKICEMTEMKPLSHTDIFDVLARICSNEKIAYEEHALKSLARRSGGDLRGAITDLQLLCQESRKLQGDIVDELTGRRQAESMPRALVKVLKTRDTDIALGAFDNVNEDTDTVILWLEENIPKEYTKPDDMARAFEMLSKADIFRGRISRRQHWRFLAYINALLSAGVAVAKDQKYGTFVDYRPTSRILKLWLAKQKNMKKKAIAAKIAMKTHSSVKEAIKSTMPYYQLIFRKNKAVGGRLGDELELDKEEAEWMRK